MVIKQTTDTGEPSAIEPQQTGECVYQALAESEFYFHTRAVWNIHGDGTGA
jgi:hypothetical protein